MPSALSSPTMLGLYINSFTKRSSSTNPYKQLLGVDGFGNYSGGNKLTGLFNYTSQFGYNYGIFYDLAAPKPGDDLVFTNAVTDETFLPLGLSVLDTVMPQAHAAGLVDRAAVCNIFQPQMIPVGTQYKQYDGISQIKKIINYNNSISNDPTKRFSWINIETEFWNFPYNAAATSSGTVNQSNNYGTSANQPGLRKTASAPSNIFAGLSVNDFVKFGNEWRQVVYIGTNYILVDRPWNTISGGANTFQYLNSGSTVDYETFLYRITKACQYINQFGNGEQMDIYVGFPQYSEGTQQLSRLYQVGVNRILLTNYQKLPNWSYVDGSYAPFTSNYHRVSDDIVSDGVIRQLGFIVSVESATNNNSSCPNNYTNNNFAAYFMEGKSVTPHSTSTNFKPVDGSGTIVSSCNCCATTLYPPPPTFNSLTLDEVWQYTAESAPVGVGYVAKGSNTFNDTITAGGTTGTNLDNYINLDTMVIFDQEFMRQLTISPLISFAYTESHQNVSCNGLSDGMISLSITGGTQPYTFLWEVYDTGSSSWITADMYPGYLTDQITALNANDYRCTITDADLNTITTSTITITEPTALSIADWIGTDATCSGTLGSITLNEVNGGTGNYLACVIPSGDTPTGWINFTDPSPFLVFPNLIPGDYDLYLADSDPNSGCITSLGPITIDTTAAGALTATHTNASCNGGYGSITGSAGFDQYILSDGTLTALQSNTTGIFTNLLAGDYILQAVDGSCDTKTVSITITEPSAITLSTPHKDPTCYNESKGTISASASGGNGSPFSYTLTYPSGTTSTNTSGNFVNLSSGTYSVYVEDSDGCAGPTNSVIISNPTPISANFSVIQPIQGTSTLGSIELSTITGGSSPYTFSWSSGETTSDITGKSPGTYSVTITDNNSCTLTYSFILRIECPTFTLEELKVLAYKTQCCLGTLSTKYIRLTQEGLYQQAEECATNQKVLSMALETFLCTQSPGTEPRISCEEMQNIIDLVNHICPCECCEEPGTQTINVTYDPTTGSLNQA